MTNLVGLYVTSMCILMVLLGCASSPTGQPYTLTITGEARRSTLAAEANRQAFLRYLAEQEVLVFGQETGEALFSDVIHARRARAVSISRSRLSDSSLRFLVLVPTLRELWISDVPFTDGAIRYLAQLKTLESLYLVRTQITEQGLRKLEAALPNLRVLEYEPGSGYGSPIDM